MCALCSCTLSKNAREQKTDDWRYIHTYIERRNTRNEHMNIKYKCFNLSSTQMLVNVFCISTSTILVSNTHVHIKMAACSSMSLSLSLSLCASRLKSYFFVCVFFLENWKHTLICFRYGYVAHYLKFAFHLVGHNRCHSISFSISFSLFCCFLFAHIHVMRTAYNSSLYQFSIWNQANTEPSTEHRNNFTPFWLCRWKEIEEQKEHSAGKWIREFQTEENLHHI